MQKTGVTNLPLHHGKAPLWLFKRMVKLGGEITSIIIEEYGTKEFVKRISNPYFFQSLGCVLGFDWHSSGLTTTLTGALKVAINPHSQDLGLFIAGGKGKASMKTQMEIETASEELNISSKNEEKIKNASILSAKVDNSLIQDNYQLYHHTVFITEGSSWAVVQQGMNTQSKYARRYHWLSYDLNDFINEPHSNRNSGIYCTKKEKNTLDLTSKQSSETRKTSLDLAKEKPKRITRLLNSVFENQKSILDFGNEKKLNLPKHHWIKNMDLRNKKSIEKALKISNELQPKDYEELIKIKGFGPKTLRALSLISQVIYGTEASWKDPAKFSFAHGGKDGIPYPVNRNLYDNNINFLKQTIEEARLGNTDKEKMLKRLKEE